MGPIFIFILVASVTVTYGRQLSQPDHRPLINLTHSASALHETWQTLHTNTTPNSEGGSQSGQKWTNFGVFACKGLGHALGLENTKLGEHALNLGHTSASSPAFTINNFGGDFLCDQNCQGKCVPTGNDPTIAPVSYYPFQCQCSRDHVRGCGADGFPIGTKTNIAGKFRTVCERDARCTCTKMDPNDPTGATYTGFLCNWIEIFGLLKLSPKLTFDYKITYDPDLSPIRWCDCCPKVH